ncbi:hypothetical protein BO71DRAFT_295824, partial [Aspergillus ellipticus CBS 707.79]
PTPTSEHCVHHGHCHCGAVRFTFTLSRPLPEYPVNSCNCPICTRNGYLLVYPARQDFTLETGQADLRQYTFPRLVAQHQFCGRCGSSCFIQLLEEDAPPIVAVNV